MLSLVVSKETATLTLLILEWNAFQIQSGKKITTVLCISRKYLILSDDRFKLGYYTWSTENEVIPPTAAVSIRPVCRSFLHINFPLTFFEALKVTQNITI